MARTFGAESTTDEVLEGRDLTGKRILITGVSAGLGVETTRALAGHGAEVVGTARDLAKARRATDGVVRGKFEMVACDLASLKSVRACADELNARGKPFDVIIANAGVMACPQAKTEDGFETQFGTNHLGHFVLINRLAPLLKSGARVVMLSSLAHRFSDVSLDDPNFEKAPYNEFSSYGRSKTANVLFAVEFDRRHKARGVRATALHPGAIQTELSRHMTPETMARAEEARKRFSNSASAQRHIKNVPQGAATSVWAAVVAGADEVGGCYSENCQVAAINDDSTAPEGVRSYAVDPDNAKALWALSEKLVGETF
jgi:NAD(P)-dependent dehydrogenase (short-subunit alcohol dehydrogenase family)